MSFFCREVVVEDAFPGVSPTLLLAVRDVPTFGLSDHSY